MKNTDEIKTKTLVRNFAKELKKSKMNLKRVHFCTCDLCYAKPKHERVILEIEVTYDESTRITNGPYCDSPHTLSTSEGFLHLIEDSDVQRKRPNKSLKQGKPGRGNWRYYKQRAIQRASE